jgi:hypothetical protein
VKAKVNNQSVWLSPLVPEGNSSVQFRGDHIRVELGKGYKVDRNKRNEFWDLIKAACQKHKSCRVLVEGFVPGGERDTPDIVEAARKTAVVPKLWLAFCLIGHMPAGQSELFEAIAASQGVRVKFFSNSKTALRWLRNNAPA